MNTKEDIIEKVKKLLNLAEKSSNSNDEEANQALLKAHELMAKHDISMDEATLGEEDPLVTETCNHKWDMGFRKPLAVIIADNFKCKVYLQNKKSVTFLGRALDARIAREAFEYAYAYAMREGNKHYNSAYQFGKETKGVFNSYTTGFILGLKSALEKQSVALMVVTPPQVKEAFEEMKANGNWKQASSFKSSYVDADAYNSGVSDGKTILNGKKLEA